MHSTHHHPPPLDPHPNHNHQPIHPPSRLFRFSYKLQFYNTLQKLYGPTRQALLQQPLGAARDQTGLVCASRMGATPTKSSFYAKLHNPPTNSLLFTRKFKTKRMEDEKTNLDREKEQRGQNGRQMKEETKIGWKRDQLEMFPEIYEEEGEESNSCQIRDKLQPSNSNSANSMQQQDIQNMQYNYQIQSVTPPRVETKNGYKQQPHTPPRQPIHNSNHNTPLFISERNNESEISCSQKKSYQRKNITSRYQSPEDMNESQSQLQRYLQLMQQQIKATLYGQNIEAFIKSWINRSITPHPRQYAYFNHPTTAKKEPRETQKEQGGEERESQMQMIKQTEPMENESSIIERVLQGGQSEEYRMPTLEAILNYNAPEFCFRDNHEEQQLFQLNQFLLN